MKKGINEIFRMQQLAGILNEIGDKLLAPYKFTSSGKGIYKFTNDSGTDYIIVIEEDENNANKINLSFNVVDDSVEDPYATETNEGDIYRIMATVVTAGKEYLSKYPNVTNISITPSKSNIEDNRRLNLYLNYVKKQFPDWDIKVTKDLYQKILLKKKK
jgi:hypothetical protein